MTVTLAALAPVKTCTWGGDVPGAIRDASVRQGGRRHGCKYLTVRELADRIGISAYTVRQWARMGKIPARKCGKDWQFEVELVERVLNVKAGNAALRDLSRAEGRG